VQELKIEILKNATTILVVCSLLIAAVITYGAISNQHIGARAAGDVDVAVMSINAVVYYPMVYSYKWDMRIGNGNPLPAILVYQLDIKRLDSNPDVTELQVDVSLLRVNLTYSPFETSRYVNTTSIQLKSQEDQIVTLTWCEDGHNSSLGAYADIHYPSDASIGVEWQMNGVVNVTSVGFTDNVLSNNVALCGSTTIAKTLPGDITGNGYVDIYDAIILAGNYNKHVP
jgi:hypothetical protein